jgi:outer membrane protein assembly factor BamB
MTLSFFAAKRPCIAAIVAAIVIAGLSSMHPRDAGAVPFGMTGYSGSEGVSCDSCHGGGALPEVRLDGPQEAEVGEAIALRVLVSSQSEQQTIAGFDVAADAGDFEALAGQGAKTEFGEITHDGPKQNTAGEASWDFLWRAPQAPGWYTLYASGLSADGRRNRGGDGSARVTLDIEVTGPCLGDCDGDTSVIVAELVRGVNIALQLFPLDVCPGFDRDGDGRVSIDELMAAVQNALFGCGHTVEPTATLSPTSTPTPLPTSGSPTACVTIEPSGFEWPTYGGSHLRTFYNSQETRITRHNVATLRPKWRYLTGAIITASPTVAYIDVPGEGRIKVVFVASWDGNMYALRASSGSKLWHYTMKPHPGGSYPQAASAEVAEVAGEQRVYVAGGMTVYALHAATGELRWTFDAGTGCTDCDNRTERNEIESSPAVADGKVFFSMDVNDSPPGKGGSYAVDAVDGRLVWYFDLETGATCRPEAEDDVRRFDGFHTAAELGLPEDFFATREGCDFDRTWTACGNVWSSFAIDPSRRAIYTASSNCDTDDDPDTVEPPFPMPPYDEAVFALGFDGVPLWTWRPREIDNADLSFGAVPNLFEVEIEGLEREVLGIGNKDGTYYLLDRDGVNELTGQIEPYWQTRVVPGGSIGGIIASAAVGGGQVIFSTAIGWELTRWQLPAAWGLRATDGQVLWSNGDAQPSYAPTSAIPGVTFMGGLFSFKMHSYDTDSGERLFNSPFLGGPLASAATVVDGEVFIGTGVGERSRNPDSVAHQQSLFPSHVTAFCLPDDCDCPAELCDDGNPCTYDFHGDGGCESEPATDGLPCTVGDVEGSCAAATCSP